MRITPKNAFKRAMLRLFWRFYGEKKNAKRVLNRSALVNGRKPVNSNRICTRQKNNFHISLVLKTPKIPTTIHHCRSVHSVRGNTLYNRKTGLDEAIATREYQLPRTLSYFITLFFFVLRPWRSTGINSIRIGPTNLFLRFQFRFRSTRHENSHGFIPRNN